MKEENYNVIGKSIPQIGSWEKVTGTAKFTADIKVDRPLIIKILRSGVAAGKIIKIDTAKAKSLSGVNAIITGDDIKNTFGVLPISKDEPAIAKGQVRYVGEPIAAVAAETEAMAMEAIKLIEVQIDATKACFSAEEGLKEVAEPIHPELKKKNMDDKIKRFTSNLGNI